MEDEGKISKREFLKRGLRRTGLSVATWYVAPAVEVLLTANDARAQGACNPPCPPNQCSPLIEDCGPVFCSPTQPCVPTA